MEKVSVIILGYYHLIGIMCGLAIYNFTIINVPFPLVLYTKLLGDKKVSFFSVLTFFS
jgi:hypothetical protein